ncbi:MAG: YtxH domain-containing protein [Chloroflexi bacterium]|nr:YtxH domain-containing protein [Chloroflexota bacterium]
MKRIWSFFSGAVMGALVGATLAILLAPSSGEDIRTQMRQRVEQLQSELKDAAQSRRIELERQIASMRKPQKPSTSEEA